MREKLCAFKGEFSTTEKRRGIGRWLIHVRREISLTNFHDRHRSPGWDSKFSSLQGGMRGAAFDCQISRGNAIIWIVSKTRGADTQHSVSPFQFYGKFFTLSLTQTFPEFQMIFHWRYFYSGFCICKRIGQLKWIHFLTLFIRKFNDNFFYTLWYFVNVFGVMKFLHIHMIQNTQLF